MDPLSIASIGTSFLGNLFKGVTGFIFGNQQDALEKARALQANQEGTVNSEIALQQGNETAARAATQAAANGGGFGGSAMGVISQASNMAMFNARNQIYRGQTEAAADIYQGQVAKEQGINELIGGVFQGVGSAVTGDLENQYRQQIMSNFGEAHGEGPDPYGYGGDGVADTGDTGEAPPDWTGGGGDDMMAAMAA